MSFRLQTIRGATWSSFESLGAQVISFLVFLLLARLLSPSDFGVVALANICVLVAQFFIFQGLGQAILQFADLDDLHLDTIFWMNLVTALVFAVVILAGAPCLESWFQAPKLASVLRGLSPLFLLAALSNVPNNLLTRQLQFRTLALRTLLACALGGVAAIAMALRGAGPWSLIGQQLTVGLTNFIALWIACAWRPRFRFSTDRARRLYRFGRHVLWTNLVGLANRRLDQVFVGRAFGSTVVGFYAVGARVALLVNDILTRSLGRVTTTVLSRIQEELERFRSAVYRIAQAQSVFLFPVALGLALVAPDVMSICFGTKWSAAVPVMQLLLLACPFEAMLALHQSALVSLGKPSWCSALATLHAAVNLLAFAAAIHWGPGAVAAAYTIRAAILYPVELLLLRRLAGFSMARFAHLLAPQAAAAILMAIAVTAVRHWVGPTAPWLLLLLSAAAGAVTYLACLLAFNRELLSELWHQSYAVKHRPA